MTDNRSHCPWHHSPTCACSTDPYVIDVILSGMHRHCFNRIDRRTYRHILKGEK